MKPQSSLKKSPTKAPAERVVKDIRRATRRHFSAEDKIRIGDGQHHHARTHGPLSHIGAAQWASYSIP